jgi:hypothetical protein
MSKPQTKPQKSYEEKIAVRDEKIQQLMNEKKQIIQRHKAQERKERTNRLCRRHGLLEKFMPDIITISDEQFELFIKTGIDTQYGRTRLAEIAAKEDTAAAITSQPATLKTDDRKYIEIDIDDETENCDYEIENDDV